MGSRAGFSKANITADATGGKKVRKTEERPSLAAQQALAEKLSRPVTSLKLEGLSRVDGRVGLSQLESRGLRTIGDLVRFKEEDLMKVPFARGERFREELKKELRSMGLGLGMLNESEGRKGTREYLEREDRVTNLARHIRELNLSIRAANCLQDANIRFVDDLVVKTEEDMLKSKNFGRKTLRELKGVLGGMGLSFGMMLDEKTLADIKLLREG